MLHPNCPGYIGTSSINEFYKVLNYHECKSQEVRYQVRQEVRILFDRFHKLPRKKVYEMYGWCVTFYLLDMLMYNTFVIVL